MARSGAKLSEIDAEIARLMQATALLSSAGTTGINRKTSRPSKTAATVVPSIPKAKQRKTMGADVRERVRQAQIKRRTAVKRAAQDFHRTIVEGEEENRKGCCLIGISQLDRNFAVYQRLIKSKNFPWREFRRDEYRGCGELPGDQGHLPTVHPIGHSPMEMARRSPSSQVSDHTESDRRCPQNSSGRLAVKQFV